MRQDGRLHVVANRGFVLARRGIEREATTERLAPGIASATARAAWLVGAFALAVSFSPSLANGNARFEGVATCAGSTCHGRAEGNGAVVRQDEIAIWQEPSSPSGAHSRAYAVLAGTRGRQIAASLGLGDATSAPACLGCHSTYAPVSRRGNRFLLSDGVGCESCHGPSGEWLPLHYARPATHASNLEAGLVPLENPQVRARICLDCHYGSAKTGQFVTHSMMAAGHPRIAFELDLFSALQQHHDADADYRARKRTPGSVQMWAVGQAEAVRRATSLFTRPALAQRGIFPEFYFYDCHSCHRAISDGPSRKLTFETNPGRPIPFGNPPFNDENIITLSAVVRALAPERAQDFLDASRAFHRAMGTGRAEASAAAGVLHGQAAQLSDTLAARSYASSDAFGVIATIAGQATAPRFTDYAGSVQAVMAIDTLLNALVRERRVTVGAAAGIRADLNLAYDAVRSPNSHSPRQFRAALKSAAGAIGKLQ